MPFRIPNPRRPIQLGLSLAVLVAAAACSSDISLDPNPSPDSVVAALFDPTNAIPVLQYNPSPTALVQEDAADLNGDLLFGDLNFAALAPLPCERPSTAQCLPFISSGGWPTTDNITADLFFTSRLVEASIPAGIQLFAVDPADPTAASLVTVTSTQTNVPAPPAACIEEFDLSQDQVDAYTSATRVSLAPVDGWQENFLYFIVATRGLQGVPLEDQDSVDPRTVEPAALFYSLVIEGQTNTEGVDIPDRPSAADPLLNQSLRVPPATEAFFVDSSTVVTYRLNGSLDTQVRGGLQAAEPAIREAIEAEVPDGTPDDVIDDLVNAELERLYQEQAAGLFGLSQFFNALANQVLALGIQRSDLVYASTWSTGSAPVDLGPLPRLTFAPDPTGVNNQTPFPNVPLLTTATVTADGRPDVQNSFPLTGDAFTDSVFIALNELNGFSNVEPIELTTTLPVSPASLTPESVLLVPYDPTSNTPSGAPVPVNVTASAEVVGTDIGGRDLYGLAVEPLIPLAPDTFYALLVLNGAAGGLVSTPETGSLPIVADDTFILLGVSSEEELRATLECALIDPVTGEFPPPEVVDAQVALVEQGLQRERWQPAFEVFEALTANSTTATRQALATAVPYKTESLTATMDLIAEDLLPNLYPTLTDTATQAVIKPVAGFQFEGLAAQAFICAGLCQNGLMNNDAGGSTPVAPGQCQDIGNLPPELFSHSVCTISSSNITEARLFDGRFYTLISGNPNVTGTFGDLETPRVQRLQFWYFAGDGTPPAGGRPIAIFQHGFTTNKESVLPLVNALANANNEGGWATVAVDMPFHGVRASDIINNADTSPCLNVNPDDIMCAPDRTCTNIAGGPVCDGQQDFVFDGSRDLSGFGFVSLNLPATRDNLRQSIVDQLTLIQHIQNGELDGLVNDPSVDGSRIGVVAQSLGGIVAGSAAAYTPGVEAAVLNVTGGGVVDIFLNTVPTFSLQIYQGLIGAGVCVPLNENNPTEGCEDTTTFRQFTILAQTVVDSGDPLPHAAVIDDGVGVDGLLMQIVEPDPVFYNPASERLGIAYGFDLMDAAGPYQTFDYSTTAGGTIGSGCHGALLDFRNPLAPPNGALCGSDIDDAVCATFGMQAQAAAYLEDQTISGQRLPMVGNISCE